MDPITVSVIIILGKYALDKGVELGKAVGPDALKTAKEMFKIALDKIKQVDPRTAKKFLENPERVKAMAEDALDEVVQADKNLAAKLQTLLDEYEQAAKEYVESTGQTYTATAGDNSIIAQGGSVVNTGDGVAVGGDVEGGIHVNRPEKKP